MNPDHDFPRCCFIVDPSPFRDAHQCRFKARANGFCIRHDPAAMRRTAVERIAKAQGALVALDKKLATLRPQPK